MSDVPSVNAEPNPVPDNEASDTQWVDPIFAEMHPERLTDEPEPTSEEIAEAEKATQAEEAAAAEADRKANGQYTKAELAKLIDELPEDDAEAKEPEAGEAEEEAAKAAKTEEDKKAAEAEDNKEDDGAEEAKAGKKPRRRSKARRDRRAMERQLQDKDAEIARLKGAPQAEPEPAAEAQPVLDDFETADEWAAELGKWTQNQIDAGKNQVAKAEEAKRIAVVQETVRKRVEAYEERAEDMRDLHDDYDDVITDEHLKITPLMAEVIMESELGPQLAYHLGSNPEESARIAGLNPTAQTKALVEIEIRLEAEKANTPKEDEPAEGEEAEEADPKSTPVAAKAPRQTPTKAPEPITTVGGGAAARPDASKTSMKDYYAGRLSGKIS